MNRFLFLFLLTPALAVAQAPDLILTNGRIFTSDTAGLYVEALAIRNGRITATGTTAAIEKLAGTTTKRLNLTGMLVVPGFNDAHIHLPDGLRSTPLALAGMNPTWPVLLDSLRQTVQRVPEGTWIEATIGPGIANLPTATRFALDSIAPRHPVRLRGYWGHVTVFNTRALREIGLSDTQPDPKGGFYERRSDGRTLTGKAFERSAAQPPAFYPKLTAQRDTSAYVAMLRQVGRNLLKMGVTSAQNMTSWPDADEAVTLLRQAGLPLRLRLIRWGDIAPDGQVLVPGKALPKHPAGLPLLTVSGTKWLLDGAPIEGGAAMLGEYPGRPGWRGRMNYSRADMVAMFQEARQRGDQLHLHLVGDRAIGEALNLLDSLGGDWKPQRVRIEHGDGFNRLPKYYEQARRLGVILVQNPTHFAPIPSVPILAKSGPSVGAFGSVAKAGIPVAIGSDGALSPYLNLMFASTHPLIPGEAMTREQAVIAYTRTAAYAEFEEANKGTLTVGKWADLAVLSQDIFKVPPPRLLQTESILTLVGGTIVYDAGLLK